MWSRLWRLRRLFTHGRLVVRLLREPSVPLATKSVPALALLYVLSPLDLLPDVLPGIGELDDLAMVLVALRVFTWLCPGPAVRHHEAARRLKPDDPAIRFNLGAALQDAGRPADAFWACAILSRVPREELLNDTRGLRRKSCGIGKRRPSSRGRCDSRLLREDPRPGRGPDDRQPARVGEPNRSRRPLHAIASRAPAHASLPRFARGAPWAAARESRGALVLWRRARAGGRGPGSRSSPSRWDGAPR